MRTIYSRNVFIDSEVGTTQRGADTKVSFPANEFSCIGSQLMKLTLTSFEMRKNFYNIASGVNNTFFYFDGTAAYSPIVIPQKVYTTGAQIATEIQTQLVALFVGSTCTHDAATRKYTLTLGAGAVAASYFVCFQVKNNTPAPPVGVSDANYFQDIHEILGCVPTRDGWDTRNGGFPLNAFSASGTGLAGAPLGPTPVTHITPFVSSLNSLEALYLTCSLPTNNFQSVNFERNSPIVSQDLIPSQLLARIPLAKAFYVPETPFITFEDPDGLFSLTMDGLQQLGTVTFSLKDDKGRPIWEVLQGQAQAGLLSYKMSMRFEILEQETPVHEFRTPAPPLRTQQVNQPFQ